MNIHPWSGEVQSKASICKGCWTSTILETQVIHNTKMIINLKKKWFAAKLWKAWGYCIKHHTKVDQDLNMDKLTVRWPGIILETWLSLRCFSSFPDIQIRTDSSWMNQKQKHTYYSIHKFNKGELQQSSIVNIQQHQTEYTQNNTFR
jgi:hypothetical protein